MKKKYYTPAMEAFHPGFEYEYQEEANGEFKPKTHTYFTEEEIHSWVGSCTDPTMIVPIFYRVKFLDKEDIESFGYKLTSKDKEVNLIFNKDGGDLYYNTKLNALIIYRQSANFETCIFDGIVNNISELRIVLKQIGIIK